MANKELTPEVVRERVLADPNTAKIAKELDIPLEEYVEQVVHFVLNPDAEPQMLVLEDADLIKLGHPPPDAQKMLAFVKEAVAVADAGGASTGFEAAKKRAVSLDGGEGASQAHTNPQLEEELKKQLRGSKKG